MNQRSIHEEDVLVKIIEPELVKRLMAYVKPYGIKVTISILLLILTAGLEQLLPYITKVAIDDYIIGKDFQGLIRIVIIYFIVAGSVSAFKILQTIITGWVGESVMFDLREQIFAHIQKQSLRFFDRNPVGRLVTRTTNDVQTLSEIFSSGIVVVFGDLITLIGITIAMFLMNWRLAIFALIVVPVITIVAFTFRIKLRAAFRQVRVEVAAINSYLQEHLSGMRIVQLFNHESKAESGFAEVNRRAMKAHLRTVALFSVLFPLMEISGAVLTAIILVRGGFLIENEVLTIGAMIAFFQYGERFFRPIRDLAEKFNIFQSGMASAERVFNLLDSDSDLSDSNNAKEIKDVKGNIKFENVSFSYNEKEEVLKNVSFEVKHGETVAIVGSTGAGKTTIANLVGRFYDVNSGKICLDGQDVREWRQADLHKNICFVQQDVFLFQGNIKQNITLGDEFSDEEIIKAAQAANADKFINNLPGKYDEAVVERGATLSSGQRQLLSFARAIIRDPKVLILDEATSSIDPETEYIIQDALKKLLKGRTSIIIAHRLATIRNADKILVFHHGCLVESGTHEELLKLNGVYQRLYTLQYSQVA